jgi:hypothetical protein
MNPDDFEKQLQSRPIRPVPREWRGDILQAAKTHATQPSTPGSRQSSWWRELLWPCPQAWAGLAAVWIIILTLNSAGPGDPTTIAKRPASPARETLLALREQRRLLTELMAPVADASEPTKVQAPRPRSDALTSTKFA